jgi:L-serine deaminase
MLLKACIRERLQYSCIVKKEEEEWGTKEMKKKEIEVLWDVISVVS